MHRQHLIPTRRKPQKPNLWCLALALWLVQGCGGFGETWISTDDVEQSEDNPIATVQQVVSDELSHCKDGRDGGFFTSAGESLGLCYQTDEAVHVFDEASTTERDLFDFSGGLAFADIDNNGSPELYVTHGGGISSALFSYEGGGFVRLEGNRGISPSSAEFGGYFIDLNGDSWVDFISVQLGGVEVFMNQGNGFFEESTEASRIFHHRATLSVAASDIDIDGDIDLAFAHWGTGWRTEKPLSEYLWINDGSGIFRDRSPHLPLVPTEGSENAFTPTFADIDSDGYPDLLMAGDFGSSQVFRNVAGRWFEDITNEHITDKNGMGAAVADFDRDGDLDWFVTSIWGDPDLYGDLYDGNRLYRNSDGKGTYEDVTRVSNVRYGGWGWGSCFADFDNDGWLDLFHTNGSDLFPEDKSVLYMGNRNGTFIESAEKLGIDHRDQGRGLLCLDYNDDGNIDILIANNRKSPTVYRNDNDNGNHFLKVKLIGLSGNAQAIGARVTITSASGTQTHEVQLGTGYLAQGPTIAHFGLGGNESVESVEVIWPDRFRSTSSIENVSADQTIVLEQPVREEIFLNVVDGAGAGIYESTDRVFLEAEIPPDGYVFSHWTSNGEGVFDDWKSEQTYFSMPAGSVTVTANYLPVTSTGPDSSVARLWNEVLLESIRNDYARPTVHARNLFHISAAMYDAWAAFGSIEALWLLGSSQGGYTCKFSKGTTDADIDESRQEALSFAAYRLILHRFSSSPSRGTIVRDADVLMSFLGYDKSLTNEGATLDDPAALGNHIASCYTRMGMIDGANEPYDYENAKYRPVNGALHPEEPGNPNIVDLNRWQPLSLVEFIDQSGNPSSSEPAFIGAEWGSVLSFALDENDLTLFERDGQEYWVYHDPGEPPFIHGSRIDEYRWGFERVAVWSSQLDPSDDVQVDISPSSIGNISAYPETFDEYQTFYKDGLSPDFNLGYEVNPSTGLSYTPQLVKRGDFTRVLAEFWADGPDSETPPGHWFVILNSVTDHPELSKRLGGTGPELDNLEWDVKAYFSLGGAMHDAAIAAWGVKGWYDYIRPISAIRAMSDQGQSSDPDQVSYSTMGLELHEGFIELIDSEDPLAGESNEHVGKIKLLAWRGPDYIEDSSIDVAGVGWIRAENWWPYQRPSFVTPPFAGYVSGHSTYSSAAAEVLTRLTGSEYFPGGMSSFDIPADEFLKFERGPSGPMVLQWAKYKDAADQCSLSRIWGGIHPPHDDIPGRIIGRKVGVDAFEKAVLYFAGSVGD